jgi:cation:H+ antiporter
VPIVPILFAVAGIGLLTLGADLLVRSAVVMAERFGLSRLIIGLTVVAYGTSMPELTVSVGSAFWGRNGVALGNAIGSNIFNVLVVLGGSALIRPLGISRQLLRLDVPVMIATAALALFVSLDGRIGRMDGVLLLALAVVYTFALVHVARKDGASDAPEEAPEDETPEPSAQRGGLANGAMLLLGFVLLIVGSRLLVAGAVAIARWLGLSELLIGLTVVAAGTSMPELATSFVAVWHKHRDLAVGNVVGSNIFNVLVVLGSAAALAPHGLHVPRGVLTFDMPVMIIVSIACMPVFFTGWEISRAEGLVFLGYYVLYVVYLALHHTGHDAADLLRGAIVDFAAPLTALMLAIFVARQVVSGASRSSKRERPPGAGR